MSELGKTIAKNASVLMGSQLTTWVLTLLLTFFLTRYLGPEGIGTYRLALSIWAIMAILNGFGMDKLMTKEIARDRSQTAVLWGNSMVLRTMLYVISFGIVFAYVTVVNNIATTPKYSDEAILVIGIIGLAYLFVQYGTASRAALEGLERMSAISLGDIASKALTTLVTLVLIVTKQGILPISAVIIAGSLVSWLIQYRALRKLEPVRLQFDPKVAFRMLKDGSPYLLVYGIQIIYVQVDIIVISLLVDETTIGWYGAADTLFATLLFVPTVFMTAVFPALSRLHAQEDGNMSQIMGRSFDLLLLLSVPIGLGVFAIAQPLVVLLFGEQFVNSGAVLMVYGLVLILTYQNILIGTFLIAADRQNSWSLVMGLATLATIPLDLILIPLMVERFGNGAIGGALAFVITEAAMVIVGLRLLPQGALTKDNLWRGLRIVFAGLIMLAAIWQIRFLPLPIPILAGILTYSILILLLQVVPKGDITIIKSVVGQKVSRFSRKEQSAH